MLPEHIFAIFFSFFACVSTTIGIFIIWKYKEWGKRNVVYFMSFAAGLLIAVSMLHIIPESFEMTVSAPIFLLLGFLCIHLYDRLLENHTNSSHDKESGDRYSLGIISAWGIGIHSFIDGIVYMVTFSVSMFTGIVTSVAMIFHEIPEGIITFLLLKEAGFSERKSFTYAFVAAAISTPLGAILVYPLINDLGDQILGALFALSGGVLLYVGASRLLPEGENGKVLYSLIAFTVGIVIALIIIMGH